jgi:predicted transcriptional regulator
MTHREKVVQCVKQAGKKGTTTTAIIEQTGLSHSQAWTLLADVMKRGQIHRAKISHKNVRYFACAADAMRYEAHHKPKVSSAVVRVKAAEWDGNTPVDYSQAKVTICPSPPEFGPMAKLRGIGT